MGSIGGWELVLIVVVALLLFGPRKLPEIGKVLGRAMGDLRRATTDLKLNLEREVNLEQVKDLRGSIQSARQEVSDTVNQLRDLGAAPQAGPAPAPPSAGPGAETGSDRPEQPPDPEPDAGSKPQSS